jgi:hypothetical protein
VIDAELVASRGKRTYEHKYARRSTVKLTDAIKNALENMDREYCRLSQMDYAETDFPKLLSEAKYLERPFAYEFYHQLRRIIENNRVDFGGALVQGEVDKRYQHVPAVKDIPDFIIHLPSSPKNNFAVIEFKLGSREVGDIKDDLRKLVDFQGECLKYEHIVEVLIGSKRELELRRDPLRSKVQSLKVPITIVEFDLGSWQASVE